MQAIVESVAASREEEFQAFFMSEAERIRRLAVFLTGDADRGADLAQEALVRTYRHWGRIKNHDPGPYCRRILVNLVRSAHRRSLLERRHIEARPPGEGVVGGPDRHVDDWLRLAPALKQLPPLRRAVIVMRFYEDMTEAQIAHALNRPLGTIKSDIHRGLAKLKALLGEHEEEES
jgi:RNA polymerase sigma-70 factor (sigma-E family)